MSITLLSLDMIFERFIVMRSFGALNADSFSIIMKGLSKEIELGTHCDVADDIALLLGVTFLRSVQHEFSLLSLDMIFERFIVMRSFGALECRQFQHHYEGAFEGNRARNSLRCR
jgi:hypothetical protein